MMRSVPMPMVMAMVRQVLMLWPHYSQIFLLGAPH
jgi:hypothetical protein